MHRFTFIWGIFLFAAGNMLLGYSLLTGISEETQFQKCIANPPPLIESGPYTFGGCGKTEHYKVFLAHSLIVLPAGIWLLIYGFYSGSNNARAPVTEIGKKDYLDIQIHKQPNKIILTLSIGIAVIVFSISVFMISTNFLDWHFFS